MYSSPITGEHGLSSSQTSGITVEQLKAIKNRYQSIADSRTSRDIGVQRGDPDPVNVDMLLSVIEQAEASSRFVQSAIEALQAGSFTNLLDSTYAHQFSYTSMQQVSRGSNVVVTKWLGVQDALHQIALLLTEPSSVG